MNDEEKKNSKEVILPDELHFPPTQMAIDPVTGEDITGKVIHQRLGELTILADNIIEFAIWRWEHNPENKMDILKEVDNYLREKIGCGSIGPATAAAAPLMEEKLNKLYAIFKEKREFE
ncbi:MAG: hypothetical protein ACTSRG_14005 [Candidatus Helarchaeota archaeon]